MSASLAAGGVRTKTTTTTSRSTLPLHPQATAVRRPPTLLSGSGTPAAAMLRSAALLRSHRLRLARLASLPEGAAAIRAGDHHAPQPQNQQQQHRSAAAAAAAPLPPARVPLFPLFPSHQHESDERLVLGIESSCDDTAAAVVTTSGRVLSAAAASQQEVHARWGGVVPALARHAHRAAIDGVVSRALQAAGVSDPSSQLSAVAVTVGPGLSLCLDVGVRKARAVAREAGVPLIPVHHMEAHALVARLAAAQQGAGGAGGAGGGAAPSAAAASSSPESTAAQPNLPFPFLCLLVSGGHNLLALARGVGDYALLGTTLDDAAGEALDKVARMLGLPAAPHGAAALEKLALQGDDSRYKFSPPMKKRRNCDFSYAGLKTGARMAIERELGGVADGGAAAVGAGGGENGGETETEERHRIRADLAASFQRAAVDHLVERTRRGVEWAREALERGSGAAGDGGGAAASSPPQLRHLVVAGGVAVNKTVRASLAKLAEEQGLELVVPPPQWCTDNGVMVAWAGCERAALGLWQPPPDPLPPLSDEEFAQASQSAREAWEQVARQYGEEAVAGAAAAAGEGGKGGRSAGGPPDVSREEAAALGEWVELRPRWPLTSEVAEGATGDVLSKKRADKMSPSLTDLTRKALEEGVGGGVEAVAGAAAATAAL